MALQRGFTLVLGFVIVLWAVPRPGDATSLRVRDLTFPPVRSTIAAHGVQPDSETRNDIGSRNTVTADPPVPRPPVTPCVDTLFKNATFAQYAGQVFSYTPPPGCPGPYAKIVFNANFAVSAGIQFDRTASIQLGNVPLFFGTTAEPDPSLAPLWHVERDVTDDAALFTRPQSGEADIFNIVDSTYTGVISGSAYLQFYPARGAIASAAPAPDLVLPFPGVAGGPQHLATPTSTLTATYTLPTNVERAYLDIYAQSQQTDEQYFLCAPTSIAPQLFACPNTAFRQTEVRIDGKPAGVAPVFPWIFTGGLDPYLWSPIPGVQTLEFKPYRVDLTPFAALLADGKAHTVSLSVDNADNYFQAIATLFAYVDHGSRRVTGGLTRDTLTAAPPAIVKTNLGGSSPSIDGTIAVNNARAYEIDGYVDTSRGRVSTAISGNIAFTNGQTYSNESATTGTLVVNQTTTAATTTLTTGARNLTLARDVVSYPLTVSLTTVLDATGTGTQVSSIDQRFVAEHALLGTGGAYASYESNEVTPADTLDILDGTSITGNTNASSTQTASAFDTGGECYSQTISAANNLLTAVSNTPCDHARAARLLQPLLAR